MKILRLALAAMLVVAACDTADQVTAPSTPRHDVITLPKPPQDAAPCDSACRSPFLGGSGG